MKSIEFDIPIYADIISMAKHGIDLKESVIDQINQGDPVWGETICEKIDELYGEEAVDKANECDLNKYIIVKEDTLYIDGNETYEAGDPSLACMGICCEFDLIQFANDYGLKELEQDGRDEI